MTDRRYEGATAEQLAHPFVQELLAIHDLFRNQMAAMLDYVDDVLQGSAQLSEPETKLRIRPLIQAGMQYTYLLHSHHHIETASLFPVLQQEGLEAAVVDRLNAEHDELGVMIDKFNDAINNLAAVDPAVMNHDLRRLAEALRAHLAYEETHVCPLLARLSRLPGFR